MPRTIAALALIATLIFAVACGDDDGDDASETPSGGASATSQSVATPDVPTVDASAPTLTAAEREPCTSISSRMLTPAISFELNADTTWLICVGDAAAGSSSKLLFRTDDGGELWDLISQTTIGNPPAQPGVGELPSGNSVAALHFQNEMAGWMGLSSPGPNFYRSIDGGVAWTVVPELPPAVPVNDIAFTSATDGIVVTSDGSWVTTDGGNTWQQAP